MSIRSNQVVFLLIFSAILGIIFGLFSNAILINYVAIGTTFFLVALYLLRKYILLWFFLFIYLVYLSPYLILYLGAGDFSSWRQGAISDIENTETLTQLAWVIILGILMTGIKFNYIDKVKVYSRTRTDYKSVMWAKPVRLAMYVMGLLPMFIFLLLLSGKSRDIWLEESGAGDVAIINIAFMMIYLCAAYFMTSWARERIWGLGFMISLASAVLFAYAGFRYCLVGVALIAVTAYMQKNPIKLSKALFFVFCAVISYALLTIIAISRNFDVSPITVLMRLASGELDSLSVISAAGAHEQNIYYSYVRTLEHRHIYYGSLYLDVIIRTLPSFIYGNFFDTTRVNDVISSIAAPSTFFDTKLNLGAFFLSEAYLNFGRIGIFIIYFASIYFLDAIESHQEKSLTQNMMYFVAVANVPNYIYYGSNSIIKIAFYSFVTILIIRTLSGIFRKS